MSELDRGTDPGRRRTKRFLSPSLKYEIWLRLVRQEVTIAEAAAAEHVDRSTIMRIRTVAKEGALAALAAPNPACRPGSGTTNFEISIVIEKNLRPLSFTPGMRRDHGRGALAH